ncbi:hypothetical protein QFC19_002471 [Naganishia cerealis]|uniref:Uncharacterized protein n=1 Tax=Naganishia cerealis TaxID=610337 RepID=A0ACC2WAM4_9TREE|nr:hypothetical protein QFC19_002471 [Naganishia cerealis]
MSQSGFSEEVSSPTGSSLGNKVNVEETGDDITHKLGSLSPNTDCSPFGGSSVDSTEGGRSLEGVDSQGSGPTPNTPMRQRSRSFASSPNLEIPSSKHHYGEQFEGQPQEQDAANSVTDLAIYVPTHETDFGIKRSGSKKSHYDDQEDKGGVQEIRITKRRLSQPRRLAAKVGSPSGRAEDPDAMEEIEHTDDGSME